MQGKEIRHELIQQIIQNEYITSQEMLLERLIAQGENLTQATLSRDLKKLKIGRLPMESGTYRYVMPELQKIKTISDNLLNSKPEGFISIEICGNMGVIKTAPAYSHTIASAIDGAEFESIAGTVAGNDTILFVIRNNFTISDLKNEFLSKIPEIGEKILTDNA